MTGPLLPDPGVTPATTLGLPTFRTGDMVLHRRRTLVIRDDVIEHVFHPIAVPATHALEVPQWLSRRRRD